MKKFCIFFACFILLLSFSFSQEGFPTLPEIKETNIQFNDKLTGAAVVVFESPENEKYLQAKQYALLKFYISPICQFISWKENNRYYRVPVSDNGPIAYHLRIQYYHPELYKQAAQAINIWLMGLNTGYQIEVPTTQIFNMPHSQVTFEITNLEKLSVKPLGVFGNLVTLASQDAISLNIPKERDTEFRNLLDSEAGIYFQIAIPYRCKDSQRNLNIVTSTGKIATQYEPKIRELEEKLLALQSQVELLKRPIMWSGYPSSHGRGDSWITYRTDVTEFNTAQDYLKITPEGIFTVKVAGYYRINMEASSLVSTHSQIRLMRYNFATNTEDSFYYGHQYSGNVWQASQADQIWKFECNDRFYVTINSSGGEKYAYHQGSPTGVHGRLQVQFLGTLR